MAALGFEPPPLGQGPDAIPLDQCVDQCVAYTDTLLNIMDFRNGFSLRHALNGQKKT